MPTQAVVESSPSQSSLQSEWPRIRAVWRSTQFGAFASVAPDGSPQVTPIGSVFLHPSEPRGYFHPIFTARLPKSLKTSSRFELLFVDGRLQSWAPALIRGRFDDFVAVRLRGHAIGPRRASTDEEIARWDRRLRGVRWTRGYELLWKHAGLTQEIAFDEFVPVRFGKMKHG